MAQISKEKTTVAQDNLTSLLKQKGLVYSAAEAMAGLEERAAKCKAEGRPMRILYGETFDQLGNTVDSLKYYFFTSMLSKSIKEKYGVEVEPVVLIADLGVYRNYPNEVDELKKSAEERKAYANRVKEVYDCDYQVMLLSEIAEGAGFKARLAKAQQLAQDDVELMSMIKKTVPEDRKEASEKVGYIYSFEEIATILGIDIKIGPPRERLYDTTANQMLGHFGVDPIMPVYLSQTYPLGVAYESYLNSPIAEYGLTAYKAGSGHMTKNRIVIGKTTAQTIEQLIDDTEIEGGGTKPNAVLDLLFIADLARQHLQKDFNMASVCALAAKYEGSAMESEELRARTFTGLQKHVLSIMPEARSLSMGEVMDATARELDPWGDRAVTGAPTGAGFNMSLVTDDMKAFFRDKTAMFDRGVVIGHNDFERIVGRIMDGKPFILISGFSSSGEFHYGHKAVIDTYKFFRQFAGAGYFVISDMDAYVSRPDTSIPDLKTAQRYAIENIADALALGVDPKDIRVQSKQAREYYNLALQIPKRLPANLMRGVLGHSDLGKYQAVYLQIADILHPQLENGSSFSLIPVGMDQKPILRLTREFAEKSQGTYDFTLPSVIYTAHVPSMVNYRDKMSKSKPGSALMLNSPEAEMKKVIAGSVTAGRDTKAEQEKFGGIPGMCPVFEMYRFNHPDSAFVTNVFQHCMNGTLLCGADKGQLREFLRADIEQHKTRRAQFMPIAQEIMHR